MKKLFFSLVVFSVLLIVGCQENSITDPVQNSTDVNKSDATTTAGYFKLQGSLENPYRVFNSYFVINGIADFQVTVQQLDPIPPNRQQIISLQLSIDAELSSICTTCSPPSNETSAGVISAEISDVLNITDDSQKSLTKSFAIDKRDDGMFLKCTFLVSTSGVTLDKMWLELPPTTSTDSSL